MHHSSSHRSRWLRWHHPGRAAAALVVVLLVSTISVGVEASVPASPATTVTGSVAWHGGPDERASLGVVACPASEETPFCPSQRVTTVAPDGSFTLALPVGRRTTWDLSAFVVAGESFMLGPSQGVVVPMAPRSPVHLNVSARVVEVSVLDVDGAPFPTGTSSVLAFPTGEGEWRFAGADEQGNALLLVDPVLEYDVSGFAINTGWLNPVWVLEDGTTFHFSEAITVVGADLPEGHPFIVAPPAGTLVQVRDGDGNPFPAGTAGVQACAGPGWPEPCTHYVATGASADGYALLDLDPVLEYDITAFATNTGWLNPDWIAEDGTTFHFSATLVILGAELPEGHTFTVTPPTGTLVRVLDGDGNPFPAGTAGVQACAGPGWPEPCTHYVATGANADGYALLDLDPGLEYDINAFATNTGWPDPWIADDGTEFHFSDGILILGADLPEGHVFTVAPPS